jgi:hypothetical protein
MSDGYYDPSPLFLLERPVAIADLVGLDARRLGHHLAALTGLPFHAIDRLVEHKAGCSLWELVLRHGPDRYRKLESEVLAAVLLDRPFGIIALGDGTLLAKENRQRLRREATVIALERDLANCYWRLRSFHAGAPPGVPPNAWHPLDWSPLTSIDQLRPYFEERLTALDGADYTVVLAGRSARRAFPEVHAFLETLGRSS